MVKKSKSKSAFTLAEISICIAIILILMQLMFPVFRSSLAKSRQVGCISNLRQIHMGLEMYLSDYSEYPPNPVSSMYPKYISSPEIFKCPLDSLVKPNDNPSDAKDKVVSTYAWPCIPRPERDQFFQKRGEDAPTVICTYHARSNVAPQDFLVLRKNGSVKRVPLSQAGDIGSTDDL